MITLKWKTETVSHCGRTFTFFWVYLKGLSVDALAYGGKSGSKPQRHREKKIWHEIISDWPRNCFSFISECDFTPTIQQVFKNPSCVWRKAFPLLAEIHFCWSFLLVNELSKSIHAGKKLWGTEGFYTRRIFHSNPVGYFPNHRWTQKLSFCFTGGNDRAAIRFEKSEWVN